MKLRGKKVTVVGLARSGLAAAELLLEQEAIVSVTDCQDQLKLRENAQRLNSAQVEIEIGKHSQGLISGRDLVVISPGVPMDAEPIVWAREQGIPVIAEIELAYAFCPAPIIAITGTNGKTTVTSLVGKIFQEAGKRSVVCGNIGNPFSAEVSKLTSQDIVVLEISSFQLETIDKFKPKVAVILNLTIDHLDRYASFDEYVQAKCRIFANQDAQDWAVLNASLANLKLLGNTAAGCVLFSREKFKREKFYYTDNHAAAIAISSLFSIPEQKAKKTCRNFKGIEHRMEQVATINDIQFVNDSKATNVDSAIWALSSIKKPIILIAGGKDKGSDFTLIKNRVKKNVRALILLGEAKEKLKQALAGTVPTEEAASLDQAVERAFGLAKAGDCVLLSPMCASFDMFSDYTQRGEVFKQLVQGLAQKLEC
ncbi:UDP-N-acetylmuramoyl-L-alanine--D-glutamate ligase [Candidatus Omnitrophota bacterium]